MNNVAIGLALANQKGGQKAALIEKIPAGLESANVLGLPALCSLGHGEFNRLTFGQAAISIRLNRGEVYEYVLSILARNKAEAFSGIEPLHCSLFHFVSCPICFEFDAGMTYRLARQACSSC
jgi:hypothetical protein